tara:strand:- start:365 stop:1054 length:690 start_codon:yes stop_codon:yes gene_type:complete
MERLMEERQLDKYRYERKYSFKGSILYSLYSSLFSKGFYISYPSRIISSIYYDTTSLYLYRISEAGVKDRIKKRVRWYNHKDSLHFEYKIKEGEIGYKKIINKIDDLWEKKEVLIDYLDTDNIYKINIPLAIEKIYFPSAAVFYKRYYLISACGNIRITLDNEIKYSKPLNINNKFLLNSWTPSSNNVMEIKYNLNIENPYSSIENILDKFRLNLTRYSKYCEAINLLK